MSVELNHTIIWCSDQARSAAFMTDILGLPPARDGHFLELITTPYGEPSS